MLRKKQPNKEKILILLIGILVGGLGAIGYSRFIDQYRVQLPIQVSTQPVIVPRTTIPTIAPVINSNEFKEVTPTPTTKPKKKSLIPKVQAKELYSYQTANLDANQDAVRILIEDRFGKTGAELVFKESGFHPTSVNSSSGACGLFQAYPCDKLKCDLSDIECQLDWGEEYIKNRYGNVENAWKFWQEHYWY